MSRPGCAISGRFDERTICGHATVGGAVCQYPGRCEHQRSAPVGVQPPPMTRTAVDLGLADWLLADIRETAEELVRAVDEAGYVLTVEQVPLQPLAMGNYETVVSVRPKRVQS